MDPAGITMRDAKSYGSIFLDGNDRKPLTRLFFNTSQKYLGVFDAGRNYDRKPIDDNGIYQFADH